jgi:hypothetical protein
MNVPADHLDDLILARIEEIAASLSPYKLLQIPHRPEPDAEPMQCFANVQRKKQRDGGAIATGWTFHHRFVADLPGPGYLYLTHHAVWLAPEGREVIDVTPYPDVRHHPLPGPGKYPIFLFDKDASPVIVVEKMISLPLKFYALADDEQLTAHVKKLSEAEHEHHLKAIEDARRG